MIQSVLAVVALQSTSGSVAATDMRPGLLSTKRTDALSVGAACTTIRLTQAGGAEVAYLFHPSVWGRGYASELVQASMEIGDNQLRLTEVHAFAQPQNGASRRVLEKAGLKTVRFVSEMDRILYRRQSQVLT